MTTGDRIEHTSFVVERELSTSPRHAFRFWSEAELKARWSGCHPDWVVLEDRFDFRAGGMEAKRWRTPDGDEQTFHAHYLVRTLDQVALGVPERLYVRAPFSVEGEAMYPVDVVVRTEGAADAAKVRYVLQIRQRRN